MSIFSRIEKQKKFNSAITSQIELLLPSIDVDLFKSPYTNSDVSEIFSNLKNCSDLLEVREYEKKAVIHNANFCNNPHVCAVCASRVSSRRQKMFRYVPDKINGVKYRQSIQEAAACYNYAYMLTATVKNGNVLTDQLQLLQNSIRNLQRMGQKRKNGRSVGEWGKIKAAIGNVENKRGEGLHEWHSHIHLLVFTDEKLNYQVYDNSIRNKIQGDAKRQFRKTTNKELLPAALEKLLLVDNDLKPILDKENDFSYIPVSKLSKEWFLSSGGTIQYDGSGQLIGYGGSCNISCEILDLYPAIKSNMHYKRKQRLNRLIKKIKDLGLNREQSIAYQSEEIFKYSTKFDGADFRNHASDFVEVLVSTKNRRLFRTYGTFRARGDNEGTEYVESEVEPAKAIYSVSFNPKTGFYGDLKDENRKLFSSSESPDKMKRFLLGETARLQGVYRKNRNLFLSEREAIAFKFDNMNDALNFIECKLDDMKEDFRLKCRDIWAEYARFFKKQQNETLPFLT
jgi:hypothetical protein